MVETYRTTSKINKQQSVKGKLWHKFQNKRGGSKWTGRLTHTNTHSKQTALPAEWNCEAAKVTGDIKVHLGKHRGKTRQEKGTSRKWIRTTPHITLHRHETWMKQKHSKTSMLRRQQRLSLMRTQSSKMHSYVNYELFKSIKQRHTQCKHIATEHSNHDKHGKHGQVHVTRKFIKKKSLIVRQGEIVTPKLMVSVNVTLNHLYGEQAAIMLSMQVDRTGHWSHLSDLPSESTPQGCTTVCDTCYLSNC